MEIMYFVLGMVAAAALVVGVVIFNMMVKINKLGEEVTQLNEGLRDALNVSHGNHQICEHRFDEIYDIYTKNLDNLNRDMDSRFDNLYRDMDSRFDKFETRFKKELIKG